MVLVDSFFVFLKKNFFIVIDIFDLVHDVKPIFHLLKVLIASGNLF